MREWFVSLDSASQFAVLLYAALLVNGGGIWLLFRLVRWLDNRRSGLQEKSESERKA